MLDRKRRKRVEERRDQARQPAEQTLRHEEDEQHGRGIEQRRKIAPDQHHLVVVVLVQQHRGRLDNEERQRAVDERRDVAVVGVERRRIRVEVLADAGGQLDCHARQRHVALVRVQVGVAVPVDVVGAHANRGGQDQQQRDVRNQRSQKREGPRRSRGLDGALAGRVDEQIRHYPYSLLASHCMAANRERVIQERPVPGNRLGSRWPIRQTKPSQRSPSISMKRKEGEPSGIGQLAQDAVVVLLGIDVLGPQSKELTQIRVVVVLGADEALAAGVMRVEGEKDVRRIEGPVHDQLIVVILHGEEVGDDLLRTVLPAPVAG